MFKWNDKSKQSPDAAGSDPAGEGANADVQTDGDGGALPMDEMNEQLMLLTAERDEAKGNLLRTLADYQNFQRRAALNEHEARRQGVTSVLGSILPVLDHFDLALTQATPDDASRRIMEGVKVIRQEFIRALENHGVTLISPLPNDEFDPTRHSAIMQQPVEGIEPGRVSATFQPGYILGERVIRSAKVAVAP